jgi:amino acid permease
MIRVLLPLAVIAAILFAPMYTEKVSGSEFGTRYQQLSGYDYVAPTLDCWTKGKFSIADDCEPNGAVKGKLIFAGVLISAVAAGLGVVGILPVVGRLTSGVTTLAGAVVLAAMAYYILSQLRSEGGAEALQWGAYLAGGGGLLTLISGLAGMRGK